MSKWWPSRESALADAGAEGEIRVGRGRLYLALAIVGIPLVGLLTGQGGAEYYLAAFFASLTAVLAVVVYRVALRRARLPWLGFATSISDVTIVSLLTASYLLVGMPAVAANSRTTFPCYLLAIAATAMRFDVRICIVTGALATLQYAAIAAIAWVIWSANATPDTAAYGEITIGQQLARLVILVGATWVSVAIVQQTSTLRLSSTHDALTGVQNRAYFRERLNEEFVRARRAARPLAVAMLDVDHFKRINDDYGHLAGDTVLRQIARTLMLNIRRTDLVARYGGEEFVIAFPESDLETAAARLEQLRVAIQSLSVAVPGLAPPVSCTASFGVAAFPTDADTVDQLIAIADERLLAAKGAGRNQVYTGPVRLLTASAPLSSG
jgi:two-component system, cell cycle response regulator